MRKIKNNDRRRRRRWIFESLPLNAIARQLGRSILLPPRIYCVCYYCHRVDFAASRASDRRPPWSMLTLRRCRYYGGGETTIYRLNFQSNLVYPIRPFSRDPVRIQLDDGESNWIRIFELDSNWIPIVSRLTASYLLLPTSLDTWR